MRIHTTFTLHAVTVPGQPPVRKTQLGSLKTSLGETEFGQ